MKRALAFVALGLALAGCARPANAKAPAVVIRYLDALEAGDARGAYDLTQLGNLAGSPGSAVDFRHFQAALRARPVRAYRIVRVHAAHVSGQPRSLFEVTAEIETSSGTHTDVFTVEPDVVQTVSVEPFILEIHGPNGITGFSVDGVAVEPQRQARLYRVIVLPGEHILRAGAREIVADSSPLTVRSGPARVDGVEPNRYLTLL